MKHLSHQELEAIVMGHVADAHARRHLALCADCARRLEREARLEDALHEAHAAPWSRVDVHRPVRATWPTLAAAAATLLIVAAGVVWLATVKPMSREAPAPAEFAGDPPCLRDPLTLAPGASTEAPTDYGMWSVAPTESLLF